MGEPPAPETPGIVVAGHICLDVLPEFLSGGLALQPGGLTQMGPVTFAAGGGVANVGSTLGKLGVPVELIAKVGDDLFGKTVADVLRRQPVTASLTLSADAATSYSVVVSPPGFDRHFLHHPGLNDHFSPTEIDPDDVTGAAFFYFGYPTLMRAVYEDGGAALANLLKAVRARGVATAVDTALPDPEGESGRVDWRAFLERVLPYVDVFVPSLAEAVYMLGADASPVDIEGGLSSGLYDLTGRLLTMGAAVAGLKLGEHGIYLRTGSRTRLAATPTTFAPGWAERELWSPAFEVGVVDTVGAGDAAYAGLLSAIVKGLDVEDAASVATATGSCSVEASGVLGGVRSWEGTLGRISGGWARTAHDASPTWTRHASGVYLGPHDRIEGVRSKE